MAGSANGQAVWFSARKQGFNSPTRCHAVEVFTATRHSSKVK
jgi:hypothetical protein